MVKIQGRRLPNSHRSIAGILLNFRQQTPLPRFSGEFPLQGLCRSEEGELVGQTMEGFMPQPVMAILAHGNEMSARARSRLGDVNEAGLVVSTVMGRAIRRARQRDDYRVDELWQDLEETLGRSRFS
jgi:hypothetical protein